ncbi:XdhC family protein [Thalassospira sp.]|uniref:XdhC family protein n=1 Tax=Thalassospira sp. TaxID=1912094 RepID=UPI003AA855B7
MNNHLSCMLSDWQKFSASTQWVLGTVYLTEGSAYRKAGAMMLVNGNGQQFGLLSGGCLEADIMRNARKAMVTGKAVMLVYDASDEDDLSFRLGIGCGGRVHIMLQPLSPGNDLGLADLHASLQRRQKGKYFQKIGDVCAYFEPDNTVFLEHASIEKRPDGDWLVTPILPEPHLLIIGGGMDARPVISLSHQLGWKTTLVDPRSANARREHFPNANVILRHLDESLIAYIHENSVDASVLMAHSISLDAKALELLSRSSVRHVSALGPRHRFAELLMQAGLKEVDLPFDVASPAGLDIGGQLPESIALSILSGIHAVLFRKDSAAVARLQAAE